MAAENKWLGLGVDSLSIGKREQSALLNAGIATIGQLLETHPRDLGKISGIGWKSFNKIRSSFAADKSLLQIYVVSRLGLGG